MGDIGNRRKGKLVAMSETGLGRRSIREQGMSLLGTALGPFLGLVLIFALFAIADQDRSRRLKKTANFATKSSIQKVLRDASQTGVAALGMTIIIIAGGIDLSVGTAIALSATVILVGLAGAYFFYVYIQNVSPGAFAAGLTLIIGATDVIIALVKAALFGLSAGMIACYKGISVGGGPAGVGNAVNETVVFTFMALFAINIVATAVAVKVTM